jgi:hypothetical protein
MTVRAAPAATAILLILIWLLPGLLIGTYAAGTRWRDLTGHGEIW